MFTMGRLENAVAGQRQTILPILLGIPHRHLLRDLAAHRVADERDLVQAEHVEEREHVIGEP